MSSGSLDESDGWRAGSDTWDNGNPVDRDWRNVPQLKSDIEQCRAVVGERNVAVTHLAVLEKFDITVSIDIHSALSITTAAAWGVDMSTPLCLGLQFSDGYVESTTPPDLKLFQRVDGAKRDFRLQFQLYNIMTAFVKRNWNKFVARSPDIMNAPGPDVPAVATVPAVANEGKNDADSAVATATANDELSASALLARLLEMGFAPAVSERLAGVCVCVEDAMHLLDVGDGDVSEDALLAYSTQQAERAARTAANAAKASATASAASTAVSQPVADYNPTTLLEDSLFKNAPVDLPGHYHGATESASRGFLVMCVWYLRQRMKTCHEFCVICDQHHVFQHGAMLKPSICTRELCVWSYQQLGVAGAANADLSTSSSLVDLLVRLAQAAASSTRNAIIFEPYPMLFDPNDRNTTIFSPTAKDFPKLSRCLEQFPSMSTLSSAGDPGTLKEIMDKAHPYNFTLMQWLISSNRSHLVTIDPACRLASMDTPHQFLMLSATPEHEARFQAARALYGSTFAFHGSPVENWHCILRTGLRNASGTARQIHGRAYGDGIYCSNLYSTSLSYCGQRTMPVSNTTQAGGFLGRNLICMALCEVVTHDLRKSNAIWVQPHEDHVVTRFFFVWEQQPSGTVLSVDTQATSGIITEINAALLVYGLPPVLTN